MTTSPAQTLPELAVERLGGVQEVRRRPVLESVPAILAPTIPDLPSPVTTTRPVTLERMDRRVDRPSKRRPRGRRPAAGGVDGGLARRRVPRGRPGLSASPA